MSNNIHAAMRAAMRDACKTGISKSSSANLGGGNVNFRGVEAAMNEISPILVNHGITITPKYSELNVTERAKDNGKFSRFATIKGSFTFAADDGSFVVAETFGEAQDVGDKAIIKAQSVSFRTAIFQIFVVPTMSMDSELDQTNEESNLLMDELDAIAKQGVSALRARYEKGGIPAEFWKRNSSELKAIAVRSDAKAAKS
jgi:hypothetical protein